MELQTMLDLIENKYNKNAALIIYIDGSGRIVDEWFPHPYQSEALYYFESVDELITHLQEIKA